MKSGISTACLYPTETEKALEQLIARGFDHFELFLNSVGELDDPVRRQLLELSRGHDMVSLHPFSSGWEGMLFFTEYNRRVADGLELYKRFFDLTAQLGAAYVIFHGSRRGIPVPWELYIQRYALVHETAKSMGVLLAHENVQRSISWEPGFFRRLRGQIPDAAFALDLKQAVRSQVDPLEMIAAMGPGLRHIHVSDAGPHSQCMPVGQGELNFPVLLETMRSQGFDGCLALELYNDSYQKPGELAESVAVLQRYIDVMDKGKNR